MNIHQAKWEMLHIQKERSFHMILFNNGKQEKSFFFLVTEREPILLNCRCCTDDDVSRAGFPEWDENVKHIEWGYAGGKSVNGNVRVFPCESFTFLVVLWLMTVQECLHFVETLNYGLGTVYTYIAMT